MTATTRTRHPHLCVPEHRGELDQIGRPTETLHRAGEQERDPIDELSWRVVVPHAQHRVLGEKLVKGGHAKTAALRQRPAGAFQDIERTGRTR